MQEQRKRLVGNVVSNKMQKTVVVEVTRTRRHPLYGKVIRVHKRYKAHDENNSCQMGDEVRIVESRPYSKEKHWLVDEILKRAEQIDTRPLQAE
jgi:small subunit ribosomal protein S17